jgi:hypothetical protein
MSPDRTMRLFPFVGKKRGAPEIGKPDPTVPESRRRVIGQSGGSIVDGTPAELYISLRPF